MLMQTKSGDGVQVGRPGADPFSDLISRASDMEIRGILARVLKSAGVPGHRAANVLRIGRTTYYEYLAVPLPEVIAEPEE